MFLQILQLSPISPYQTTLHNGKELTLFWEVVIGDGSLYFPAIIESLIRFDSYRTAQGYKVESARSDDGILASDHRPVFADITI